jgi:hypothetical protein
MAATAENVTNMINTFKKVFKDVAEFRWIDGDVSTANLATTKWDKELPILTDGMDFNQAEPSSTSVKVLGVDKDWASMHEAGTVTMKIQLPTIAEGILGWLYTASATTVATAEELLNGESGSFKGKGYSLIKKTISGTAMIISGDYKYALVVRHLEGSTSFAFSDPKSKPYAISLHYNLSGDVATADATDDFDIAFLEWNKAGV